MGQFVSYHINFVIFIRQEPDIPRASSTFCKSPYNALQISLNVPIVIRIQAKRHALTYIP